MCKTRSSKHRALMIVSSVVLAYFLLASPMGSKGAVVWSDNFNDGNYDGWTAYGGQVTVTGGILYITGTEFGMIYRNSTLNVGTWSWDMLYTNQHTPVTFFGIDANPTDAPLLSGYQMALNPDNSVVLERLTGITYNLLGNYTPSEGLSGWQHIDVTRTTEGLFRLYVNTTLAIETQDTYFDTPYTFQLGGFPGAAFDNITVSDTTDTPTPPETPTQTDTTTPAIPGYPMITIPLAIGLALTLTITIRHRTRKRTT